MDYSFSILFQAFLILIQTAHLIEEMSQSGAVGPVGIIDFRRTNDKATYYTHKGKVYQYTETLCVTGAPDNLIYSISYLSSTLKLDTESKFLKNCDKNVSIAIVGAGFAGLSTARKLKHFGIENVAIFEAENRVGGRVFPIPFEDGYLQHGAEYINGQANPIFEMAMRLDVVTSEDKDYDHIEEAEFWTGGCPIAKPLLEAFQGFTKNLENVYREMAENTKFWTLTIEEAYKKSYRKFLKRLRPSTKVKNILDTLSRFYKSYYEAEWSAPAEKLALHNFALWDDKSSKETSFSLNKLGYKTILDEIAKDIPENAILLNSKVVLVDYTDDQTKITLENGTNFSFDYVIVTVPLGHLKKHAREMFVPHLPQKKLKAIDTLGFGSNMKVFLLYEKPFWLGNFSEENASVIVPLHLENCGRKSMLSDYLHSAEPLAWNKNVLVLWFHGKGPEIIGRLTDEELNNEITEIFRNSLKNWTIPRAEKIIKTSWLTNSNFYGSYSYITPEASRLSEGAYNLLSRPVYRNKRPRILFAGEATHPRIYQTTIGAYLSGSREADRLINYLSCK